jgi:hypothetical protein
MEFCSREAQGEAILPGTAVRGHAYVFLPVPKRFWGREEFNAAWASEAEIDAVKSARRGGVVTRLYNPAAEDAAVLVHRSPSDIAAAQVADLLAAFSSRWAVDDAGAPRLAVCTQGTRDRCCAKWGYATHRRALSLFEQGVSPFEPLECSHLGGDRYAATGVFFPSGGMYAYLDSADLPSLVAAEQAGRLTAAHYRGCVFEPPLLQVVRAGLALDGLIDGAAATIALLDGEATEAVSVALDSGARFTVRLREVETAFYASCSNLDRQKRSRGVRLVYAGAEPL